MKKRFLSLFIFIASVLTGGFLLSANISALPTLPNPQTPTPTAPTTPITPATPTPTAPNPTPTPDDEEEEEEESENAAPVNNCAEQMGKMAWAICPITGIIAAGTDAAMSALSALLVVNMTSDVFDSPLYYIWGYIRNIANVIFVMMFLAMIFSHFTQWNITNYALRRAAPKLLAVAILVNLSFYISVAAVNLSDIFGVSLVGLFDSIAAQAAANGTMNLADIPTWEAVVAFAIGGGGAAAGILALLVVSGGLAGIFFVLLPILLAGLVAVLAALFTMAARQALIFLLVMLAPLAFVSLLLQGTEKYFNLWKKFFLQMLIIFPMFALLYGASRLAGWAIIVTATGMLQVVLGMAVQIVPLVMTPALLRMSGTVLGKVNELARKPFAPAQAALGTYSKEQQMIARARYLNKGMLPNTYNPSAKLSAFIAKQSALRAESYNLESGIAKNRLGAYVDNYVSAHSVKKGNHELKNKLGYVAKQSGVDELEASIAKLDRSSTLNEASGWSDSDHPAGTRGQRKLSRIAAKGSDAWLRVWTAEQRKTENDFGDEKFRNELLNDAYRANETYQALKNTTEGEATRVRLQDKLNNYQRFVAPIEGTAHRESAAAIAEGKIMRDRSVARAMSMHNMMNKKTRDAYATLFSDTKLTYDIQRSLKDSFREKDWNKMEAAIDIMAQRGDYNLITDEIADATEAGYLLDKDADGNIIDDVASEGNKRLMDTLVKYKNDAAHLAMYAKSMNIRRGKWGNFEGKVQRWMNEKMPNSSREEVIEAIYRDKASKKFVVAIEDVTPDQIQFVRKEQEDSTRAVTMVGWAADQGELGMLSLLGNITQPGIAKSQDRTTFEAIMDLMNKANHVNPDVKPNGLQAGFLVKQLRSAACSGEIDGETLTNLNTLLIGRSMPGKPGVNNEGWDSVNYASIYSYLGDMSARQLASMKAGQFAALNDALLQEDGAYASGKISPTMLHLLNNAMYDIANGNTMLKQEMNTDIRRKINVDKMSDRADKRAGSDGYLFDGDPSRPNAPLFADLEPHLLDIHARNLKGADRVSLFNHSDLAKKLNDYYLDMSSTTGSFETGQIAPELQELINAMSPTEKALLDDEMRAAFGLTGKKPSL
ncbi:hypothetical protein FWG76_01355 [Candidatus Saccharibacteria bacterium]|nr:hypothetical protein [Candidatus Saccharibacteria bacterium]